MNSKYTKILIVAGLLFGLVGSAAAYTSPSEEKGFYRMNDSSSPVLDYSGNDHDATVNGDPVFGASGIQKSSGEWDAGEAIDFDGSGDYLNAGDVVTLDKKSVTIAAFVKPTNDGNKNRILGKQDSNDFDGLQFKFSFQLNEGLKLQPFDLNTNDICNGITVQNESFGGSWWHVAGVIDRTAGECHLYVNGSLYNTSSITNNSIGNNANLQIGAREDGGGDYNGIIDEPRIAVGKAATDTEISNLYQYNNWTVSSGNSAPTVNSVEYEVSSSWVSSSSLSFNDDVTRIRANITDPDGDSITSTNLTLKDLYDSNTRLSEVANTSTSGDYFIYDVPDQELNDSGGYDTTIKASDGTDSTSFTDSFSLSWGTLSASMTDPSSDLQVNQNDTFTMSGSASCSGGECASEGEKVELWADPVPVDGKVKLESSRGQVVSGETVEVSGGCVLDPSVSTVLWKPDEICGGSPFGDGGSRVMLDWN